MKSRYARPPYRRQIGEGSWCGRSHRLHQGRLHQACKRLRLDLRHRRCDDLCSLSGFAEAQRDISSKHHPAVGTHPSTGSDDAIRRRLRGLTEQSSLTTEYRECRNAKSRDVRGPSPPERQSGERVYRGPPRTGQTSARRVVSPTLATPSKRFATQRRCCVILLVALDQVIVNGRPATVSVVDRSCTLGFDAAL